MPEFLTVDVGDASLSYCLHDDGSDLPPLVFVHGYSGRSTSGTYLPLLERLAKRFKVYAVDMRGHGASAEQMRSWSVRTLSNDLARLCSSLGLIRPAFVGHSFGAFLGMAAEIAHPGTFSALCLLAPASAYGQRSPDEQVAFFVEQGNDVVALRDMYATMFVRPTDELVEEAASATAHLNPRVHPLFFEEFATADVRDGLPGVGVPVLILLGGRDVAVPIEAQRAFAIGLPLYKEVVFSGEGHMLPLEAPGLTAREVLAFLDQDWSGPEA